MDFTQMYFTRYSPKPLIATLNPAFEGALEPLEVLVGEPAVQVGQTTLALEWADDKPALKRVTRKNEVHPLDACFRQAFPDITTLADGIRLAGNFEIEGHPTTGRIAGTYAVEKKDGVITITMIPAEGWLPRPTKFSLRFLYTVAAVFRKWPSTYEWTAHLQAQETGAYTMRSAWRRIKQ